MKHHIAAGNGMPDDSNATREMLDDFSTVDDVVAAIKKSKRMLVITGAGISVSCGIPDFRSKGIGIYNTLDCDSYGIPSAELLFDYQYFAIDPVPFYKFAHQLLPRDDIMPSLCHRFIALLESKKRLLRNYTQNVDGIEHKVGISKKKLIECHGSMTKFRCMDCNRGKLLADVTDDIKRGEVCYCRCGGILKPEITFFGERLPPAFEKAMEADVPKCDLVLVMGTSLKVGGSVHKLLQRIDKSVPQILINRDPVKPPASISKGFDVTLLGKCDDVVQYLCGRLKWDLNVELKLNPPPANNDVDVGEEGGLDPQCGLDETEMEINGAAISIPVPVGSDCDQGSMVTMTSDSIDKDIVDDEMGDITRISSCKKMIRETIAASEPMALAQTSSMLPDESLSSASRQSSTSTQTSVETTQSIPTPQLFDSLSDASIQNSMSAQPSLETLQPISSLQSSKQLPGNTRNSNAIPKNDDKLNFDSESAAVSVSALPSVFHSSSTKDDGNPSATPTPTAETSTETTSNENNHGDASIVSVPTDPAVAAAAEAVVVHDEGDDDCIHNHEAIQADADGVEVEVEVEVESKFDAEIAALLEAEGVDELGHRRSRRHIQKEKQREDLRRRQEEELAAKTAAKAAAKAAAQQSQKLKKKKRGEKEQEQKQETSTACGTSPSHAVGTSATDAKGKEKNKNKKSTEPESSAVDCSSWTCTRRCDRVYRIKNASVSDEADCDGETTDDEYDDNKEVDAEGVEAETEAGEDANKSVAVTSGRKRKVDTVAAVAKKKPLSLKRKKIA